MSIVSYVVDKYFIKQPRLRRAVTWLMAGDRNSEVELLGTKLQIHSIKENGYLRASRAARSYSVYRDEVAILLNLASLLADGDSFVDVGANVGLYSCTLARRSRIRPGKNRFYAFEANEDTFSRLILSAEPLGVTATNCAVSNRDGQLVFVAGAVSHVFTSVEHSSSYNIPSETTSVPCRRLDSFEFEGDSLFIKIDVEGQELEVLEGAAGLFELARVKGVYIDGYSNPGIPDWLRRYGFELFDGRTLLPSDGRVFSLLALAPRDTRS